MYLEANGAYLSLLDSTTLITTAGQKRRSSPIRHVVAAANEHKANSLQTGLSQIKWRNEPI